MALDAAKQVAYWIAGSDDALGTAELLINGGRYNFGLFFLHLTLEKALKAIVAKRTGDIPPKTHDLLLLARRAELVPPSDVFAVLGEFQVYCMAGRYPDTEPVTVDNALAQRELARARKAYQWLHQQLSK